MKKLLRFFSNIKPFFPYILRFKWHYIFTLIFLGTANLCQLYIPKVLKNAVDAISDQNLHNTDIKGIILQSAVWILLLGLGIYLSRVIWRMFLWLAGIRINIEIRDKFFEHLVEMDPSFYEKNRTGELMALATNDIQAVTQSFRMGVVSLFDGTFMLFMALFFMLNINPGLTFFVFLPFPLIMFITLQFNYKIHNTFKQVQEVFAEMTEFIREYVWGIRILRAHSKDVLNKEKFDEVNKKVIEKNLNLVKVQGLFFPSIFIFSQLSYLMLIYFGGRYVISKSVSMGDFVAFMSYILILTWPTMALGWSVNIFERGAASMNRLNDIFALKPATVDGKREYFSELPPDICVKDLAFHYPGSDNGINISSLDIPADSYTGLIGKTGSGKSTLLKLIMKIFTSDGIFIDGGIPLRDIKTRSIRDVISIVPQDSMLFSATIRDNIAFGNPEATDGEIEEVIDICSFRKDIESFPNGLDTLVGERGITLSGGQKQRISLARAIILKKPVLLLDDCLSAVDSETEKHILQNLKHFRKNMSVVAVSNRISTVMFADKIYVFNSGKIEASGKHAELLAASRTYYDIYEKQKLLSEIEDMEGYQESNGQGK